MNDFRITTTVLSASSFTFKGDDGQARTMYRVYIEVPSGDIGSICAFKPYYKGDPVTLELGVAQGKIKLRLVDSAGGSASIPVPDDDEDVPFSNIRSPSLATPQPLPPPPSDWDAPTPPKQINRIEK